MTPADSSEKFNYMWHADESRAHTDIAGVVESVVNRQSVRITEFQRYAALYTDRDVTGLVNGVFGRLPAAYSVRGLTLNIVRSMIDTLVSRFAANQPRVEVLTEGGDWGQQKRAKKSTKFFSGEFERLKVYRLAPIILRDALIWGDGYLKFYQDGRKICAERVFPGEIVIDDDEAINGTPRNAYQVRLVSKEVLCAKYPEYQDKIMAASLNDMGLTIRPQYADLVKVIEAWHLPSAPAAKDGVHAIVVNNCVLSWEDWEFDCFPWARVRWTEAVRGWYSQGAAEQLMGLQVEVNRLLKRIGLSIHLMAIPYYLIEAGSKVVKTHLNNDVGHMVEYYGTKPEARVNQAMNPEVYQHLERLYQKAYEIMGISSMEANARKPAGLDSQPSLSEYSDLSSERHAYNSMEWQEFFKDCAWQIARCAGDMGGAYSSRGAKGGVLEVVKWADCQFNDENFMFKVSAGNLLPTEPSGKLNKVSTMAQNGLLTPEQGLRLLQYPDIEAITGKMSAQDDYVEWAIYQMTIEEEEIQPEPFINLQKAITAVQDAYLQGQTCGMTESALQNLRKFMRDAAAMVKQAQDAQMLSMMMAQAQAQAAANPQPPPGPPPSGAGQGPMPPAGGPPMAA